MNAPDPNDRPVVLDADVVQALADGQAWESPGALGAARVKRQLLKRIAQSETRHVTVHVSDASWQPFQQGIEIKVLNEDAGIMSYLLRLAPGASLDPHGHPVDEECVVLEGSVLIGATLEVGAGGFHLARRDTLHAPITTVTGATIFLRGASPHPRDLV